MKQDPPSSTRHRLGWPAPAWEEARRAIIGWPWGTVCPGLVVLVVALALRLALVLRYPLLYDVDAYGRWLTRDHPFSTPWVPLFQVALYVLTRLADSVLAARLLSACFGAAAVLSFWLLLRRPFGVPIAYLGALWLALNPLFVTFSVVPYQEGLFFTLGFLALWLALAPDKIHWFWLTLVLALAGLTRYEGWLLSLFIWLLFLWRRRQAGALTWRFAAGSALALAWAPLLWIVVNRSVSPDMFQTLEPTLDPASLLATLGAEWSAWQLDLSLAGGVLALGGLLWLGWQARCGNELAWLLLAFLLGDLLVLAFLRPFPPGDLRLPLLSLPIVIAGVSGLLVDGAKLLWRAARQWAQPRRQRVLMVGILGLATATLLIWYVPRATERVATYDAVVLPSYLAADDLGPQEQHATLVVIGDDTMFYAFLFYAQEDGWSGQAMQLTAVPATAVNLAETLRMARARLLINYAPASASGSITALAEQGILVADTHGLGYAIWRVQAAPAPGA
ncbi:MAG TPA: glycosyltransferase family 39 protein [Ktedonobacterales bacterium]|nr:glycosyltransferase family 39 protein [Ktedonobacterales bacterium]